MNRKLKSNIALWFLISTLIYLIIILIYQKNEFDFLYLAENFKIILLVTFLVLIVYYLKYLRWIFILKKNGVNTKINKQGEIFIKSLLYSFTPGKVGEFIKAHYLKEKYSIELNKGIYLTLLEKISEVISLVLLFAYLYLSILYFALTIVSSFLILYSLFTFVDVLNKEYKNKFIKRFALNIVDIKNNFKFKDVNIYIILIVISLCLWIIEGEIFSYLVKQKIIFFSNSINYIISMFLGTISFLPAGIGLSDFSLNYLLIKDGIDEKISIFSVIIFRFITVWMPVIFSALYSLSKSLSNYVLKKSKKNNRFS